MPYLLAVGPGKAWIALTAHRWRRLVVEAAASMQVSPLFLLAGCRSVQGWYSGTSIDAEDTLAFSARTGVRPMNETLPLERASEAYDGMMSGRARFRVVLSIGR